MTTPYRYMPFVSPTYRAVRRNMNKFLYAGDQVECPLCERTFSAWLVDHRFGTCPYCRSQARQRFLWLYLAEEWKGKKARSLLQFSPEWCLQRRLRQHSGLAKYVTADLSAPEADIHVDITAMTIPDESFDVVICSHVLEHIPADRAAMKEIARVLRPNGIAYIQVPLNDALSQTDEDPGITDRAERERRFGQFDHVRMYGRDFEDRLREAGFAVSQIRPAAVVSASQMKRYGLWDDVIWRCERQ
ncbi:MAG: methyltransferase domain-containing protein [Bradyrhizobium sp.]|nr:methyltransferase domain-containing protein [Bradyrhizobium sp.]